MVDHQLKLEYADVKVELLEECCSKHYIIDTVKEEALSEDHGYSRKEEIKTLSCEPDGNMTSTAGLGHDTISPASPAYFIRKPINPKRPYRLCIFCKKSQSALTKHLRTKHRGEEQIQRILQLPRGLQLQEFKILKRQGIYAENLERSAQNKEPLRERRRRSVGRQRSNKKCQVNATKSNELITEVKKNNASCNDSDHCVLNDNAFMNVDCDSSSLCESDGSVSIGNVTLTVGPVYDASSPASPASSSRKPTNSKRPYRLCVFCKKSQSALTKHIRAKHRGEEQIKRILQLPRGLQLQEFIILKRRGIYAENLVRSAQNKEPLRERRRGKQPLEVCEKCLGYFTRRCLKKHLKTCCASSMETTLSG